MVFGTPLKLARFASRRGLLVLAGAWLALVLSAWLLPVSRGGATGETVETPSSSALDRDPGEEDLAHFLASSRWGGESLASLQTRRASEAQTQAGAADALNPELRAMGFVGVLWMADQTAILLELPEQGVQRFGVGDELPDGRRLEAVSEYRLLLSGADQSQQELPLFPPLPSLPSEGEPAPGNASD